MKVSGKGLSDVGMVRDHNEDSFYVSDEMMLYVVADGMGGHAAGDVASRIAVENIVRVVEDRYLQIREAAKNIDSGPSSGTMVMFSAENPVELMLKEAVLAANEAIIAAGQKDPKYYNMGTTTTLVFFPAEDKPYYAHVGDSRIYKVRDGETFQESDDHSLVNDRLKAGIITQEEAESSTYKNIITRSVGFNRDLKVDVAEIDVKSGDQLLLCSDGFSNYLNKGELPGLISGDNIDTKLENCINQAKDRGGDDNITVIIVNID